MQNYCLYLDEAAVKRQVVSDGVLPGSLVWAVVREPFHDELIDAWQSDPLLRALLDGHGYQSDVADTQTTRLMLIYTHTRIYIVYTFLHTHIYKTTI